MAALEPKPMRLNGLVDETTDKALYDALSGVLPRRRMALLRRLANVGLMVEQGRVAAESQVVPVAAHTATPVAVSEPSPVTLRMDPLSPSMPIVSEPKKPVADCVVTATPQKQSDANASANDKPRAPNLALMGRMNLSIMD
jgi:hypothetical protein